MQTKTTAKKEKQLTTKQGMQQILSSTNVVISVNKCIEKTAELIGLTKDSVRATSFSSANKFQVEDWFYKNYVIIDLKFKSDKIIKIICRRSAFKNKSETFTYKGFVFNKKTIKSINKTPILPPQVDYNSENKQLVREYIFSSLPDSKRNYNVLTFGASEGIDVKYLNTKFPNVTVYNVERYKHVNTVYNINKKKYKLISNDIVDTVKNFLRDYSNIPFYLINYDADGYFCEGRSKDLLDINYNKRCEYLYVTVAELNGMRNNSASLFIKKMIKKYGKKTDIASAWINDEMTNYEVLDRISYRQEDRITNMQVFKLKLKN